MITKLTHANVFVLDMDRAYDFYVDRLDFEVRTNVSFDDQRWLTVGPKDQPQMEIVLTHVTEGERFSAEQAEMLRKLVTGGAFGGGVFGCDDLQSTYETLRGKKVEFSKPPTREHYGYEAVFKDDSGNWFSLVEEE